MAPSTRSKSKRAKTLQDAQSLIPSGFAVNTSGFPALPADIYLEIISHLPALPIPHDVWVGNKPDPYRQLTLYSLSQTCRSLRNFFLRYAWQRIEVFGGMWTPNGRLVTKAERNSRGLRKRDLCDKLVLDETLRQLETVTVRNPELRKYVSIVNLPLVRYAKKFLPEIEQDLSLLPNLHTLQLKFGFYPVMGERYFSHFRYPSIHTLNISRISPLGDILRACPNTRNFSFYKDVGNVLSFALRDRHIEKLGVVTDYYLPGILPRLPRLRDLSLECWFLREHGEKLDFLSLLPLHTIRLRLDLGLPDQPGERRKWIDLAKELLAKCPKQEATKKKVIVVKADKTVEVHDV